MNVNGENVQCADLAVESQLIALANKRAIADPLPGPAGDAFCSGPIEVGGKIVYKVVPRHFQALKAIGSPLIGIMQDVVSTGKVETEFDDEQAWEICWIFTHTGKQVREVFTKGVSAIKEAAMVEVGECEDYPVNLVIFAIMEQLKRHMSTAIKYNAEAQERGDVSFFRDSGMSQKTDTAGS